MALNLINSPEVKKEIIRNDPENKKSQIQDEQWWSQDLKSRGANLVRRIFV